MEERIIETQLNKAKEKLEAAKVLFKEGFLDDAISRAYYSVFHAVSAALLSEGITVESHDGLKTMFGLHLIKQGKIDKKFGRFLSQLKDERENGDYDIYVGFEKEDAKEAIREAKELLEEIKKFLKSKEL
ncbi:MAG: HEPN domain-containing protein [Candidatus Hydrogenedentota bacterium]